MEDFNVTVGYHAQQYRRPSLCIEPELHGDQSKHDEGDKDEQGGGQFNFFKLLQNGVTNSKL